MGAGNTKSGRATDYKWRTAENYLGYTPNDDNSYPTFYFAGYKIRYVENVKEWYVSFEFNTSEIKVYKKQDGTIEGIYNFKKVNEILKHATFHFP